MSFDSTSQRTIDLSREPVSKEDRAEVIQACLGKCYVCGYPFTQLLEIHHINPVKNGGSNDIGNLRPLCPNCHRLVHLWLSVSGKKKHPKYESLSEWIESELPGKQVKKLMELVIGVDYY